MILESKEDFEKAALNGDEIKHKTVFWTGDEPDFNIAPVAIAGDSLKVGTYDSVLGVFAGYLHGKQVWVYMKDKPKEMTWYDAMKWAEKNNKHIPSIDELTVAYLHKDEINAALAENGGEPLKNSYYWSSSEYIYNDSWELYMGNGDRNYDYKGSYAYVRVFQLL